MSNKFETQYEELEALIENGFYDEVIYKLSQIINNEQSPKLIYLLAKVSFLNGRLNEAKQLTLELTQQYPKEEKFLRLFNLINNQEIENNLLEAFNNAYKQEEIFNILKYGYRLLNYQKDKLKTHMILSETLFSMGKAELAHKHTLAALESAPNNLSLLDNAVSYLQYAPNTKPDAILTFAKNYEEAAFPQYHEKSYKSFTHLNLDPLRKKLKIGFLSGDFKSHAIFFWIGNLFTELKKEDLEIFCYCNNLHDNFTPIWSKQADHWRDINELNDFDAAKIIYEDQIDILIDLSGHTDLNRLGIISLRPSPIQASWLGQAGPIGIRNLDYSIADTKLFKKNEDYCYLEKIYSFPDFQSSFNIDYAYHFDRILTHAAYKTNGFITFGSFNNMIKMNKTGFNTWIKILKAIPSSKLYLKNHGLSNKDIQTYVRNYFLQKGITAERLILEGPNLIRGEYLDCYSKVDICLDPIPVGGCTTSIDAIFAGVPIITLYGNKIPHRATASLLKNIGCDELIAFTKDEYVMKAIELAKNLTKVDFYRESIRSKFLNSNIINVRKFAKDFSIALRFMWQEFCNAQ